MLSGRLAEVRWAPKTLLRQQDLGDQDDMGPTAGDHGVPRTCSSHCRFNQPGHSRSDPDWQPWTRLNLAAGTGIPLTAFY